MSEQPRHEIVQPDLTRDEAEALLTYTKTSLVGDDNYDALTEKLSSACDELRDVLNDGE